MAPPIQTNDAEREETAVMNHNAPVKRNSLQHQTSRLSKEKGLCPSTNRSMKFQDEGKSSKSGKFIERKFTDKHPATPADADAGNSVPHMPFVNCQKPWPSRKVIGVEEVVKNMSNVPCYLQRIERGDCVQEKALNFGVLDWGRLEKWTYTQKKAANRKDGASGKQKSSDGEGLLESRTSYNSKSIRQSHEKCKSRDPNIEGIFHKKFHPPDIFSSPSTSKDHDISVLADNNVQTQIGRSVEAEEFQSCKEQNVPGSLHSDENWLQDQCSMWNHPQESIDKRRISFDSTIFNSSRPIELDRNSFSANPPDDDAQFTTLSPHIPHSCPLHALSRYDDLTDASVPLPENGVEAPVSKGKHAKHDRFTSGSSEKFSVNVADRSGPNEGKKAVALRRELSPHCLQSSGPSWMRTSSLREGLSGQVDKSHEGKGLSDSRSRRSPLRRLLDPLLKSKNHNRFSGPIASSSCRQAHGSINTDKLPVRNELKLAKKPCNSSDADLDPSTSRVSDIGNSVLDGSHVTLAGHALVKLVWKNGLPLFMFSTNDNNILAATISNRSISSKNDFDCAYTIFSAHEVKKKSGVWLSQNKSKSHHGLAYNVVGQMRVSSSQLSSYDSKNYVVREFVLFGSELKPTIHECVVPHFNTELASIIVKVQHRTENSNSHAIQSNHCRDSSQMSSAEDTGPCCHVESLQIERNLEDWSSSGITAIIPNGNHGFSSKGVPTPLIERWKSGGSCDCGGWDEGCKLTVLMDMVQKSEDSSSEESCTTTDAAHRIQLFIQGVAKENSPAFSMVAFKEGVYTVDFGEVTTLLQAFAISIATIYSRNPTNLSHLQNSVEAQSLQEHAFANYRRPVSEKPQGGAPTSYVPHHPPLSPVGRA